MSQGLSVQRLININLNLTPQGAQFINFDTAMVFGDSNVINVKERYRSYNTLDDVAQDFGTTAPEYLAARLFFSQSPQPSQFYLARWAATATSGLLVGGPLSADEQAIAQWSSIANGSFGIQINNAAMPAAITGLDFTAQSNLNGVAQVITTALGGFNVAASCLWDGEKFTFSTTATGAGSQIAPIVGGEGGTDISGMLNCTSNTLEETVSGIDAETALQALVILDGFTVQFYGVAYATTTIITDDEIIAIAGFIEGDSNPHLYAVTTAEAAALTNDDTTSIGYRLKQLGYSRTFVQYSISSLYAAISILGRGCTVNFNGNMTVINFMWKQEPGVVAESLTSTEADALDANNYNYFAQFNNQTSIIVNGTVANGHFIDEIWDCDWFLNQMQTDIYNLLYTSPTKIPQTDAGMHQIKNAIEASCSAAVNNGTLAPGQWNSAGFGNLAQGDFLFKGYYVYQPPISSQAESDRAKRKSVPFQAAAKLAGAVNTVSVTILVNQ